MGGIEMSEVLLYHHILGRTKGIEAFANELREAGHVVHVPDLFKGRTFASIDAGMAYVEDVEFDGVVEAGVRVADELPHGIIYAGFSLGVAVAQKLAQTRQGAKGALFFHSCLPASVFDAPFPLDLPVQIHSMDADPYFVGDGDIEAARSLVATSKNVELFLYPGHQHLFADSSVPSYDENATALLTKRVLEFLSKLED
jgi:dienelactone hydrolase